MLHSPVYVRADENVYWYYLAKGMRIQNDISDFDGIHACNIIGKRDRTKNKYNSIEGQLLAVSNHEGIIDSSLWLEVQEKLANNRQISRANAGKYSWLTGLLKCADCGYSVKINYNKNDSKLYLICSFLPYTRLLLLLLPELHKRNNSYRYYRLQALKIAPTDVLH